LSGKYLKARKLAREMEQKAKKTAKMKEEAKKKRKKVEELLEASLDIDIEVDVKIDEDGLRKKIEDTEEKINEKNFEEAEKDFDEVIEEIQSSNFAKLDKLFKPVKDLLELAGEGEGFKSLKEEMEEAKGLIEEGKIEKGFKKAEKIKDESEKVIEREVGNELEEIQSLLKTMDSSGKQISQLKKTVSKANYAYEADEYERAMSLINESRDVLGEKLGDQLEDMIDELEDRIKRTREMGIDVSKVEKKVEDAKELKEKKSYGKAVKSIQTGHELLDNSFTATFDKRVQEIEKEIKEAEEIGTSTEKVKDMLEEAEELKEKQQFKKARELLKGASKKVKEAKFNQVLETIAESRDYFIKAKNIGADIKEPMEMLNNARASLKEEDYKKALEWAEKGREKVEKVVKGHFEMEQKFEQRINNIKELMKLLDLEAPDLDENISEAEEHLKNRDYDEASSVIEKFEDGFHKKVYESLMEKIDEFEKLNGIGKDIDIEMDDLTEELDESVKKTKSSEYLEAAKIAENGIKTAKERIENELDHIIEDINKGVNMIDKIEEDTRGKIKDILGKAYNKLGSEKYMETHQLIKEAREELDYAQVGSAEKYIQNATELLETLESLEEDMDMEEMDLSILKEGIEKAKESFDEGEHYESIKFIDQARDELNEELQEKAEHLFGLAKKETVQAKKTGVRIEDLREKLIESKKEMKQGDYLRSIHKSLDVKQDAEKARTARKEAYEKISEVATKLSALKRDGKIEDISDIKEILVEAKEVFRDRDYSGAIETAKKADRIIQNIEKENVFEEKKKELEENISRLEGSDVEEKSKKIDALKEEVEEAEELNEKSGLQEGVEKLEKIQDEIDSILKKTIEEQLEETERSIKSAENLGMDTQVLWKEFEKIGPLVDEGNYWEGLETLNSCKTKIQELKNKYDEAEEVIERSRNKLQEAENIKADIKEGKELLEEAELDFEEDKYEESILKAKEAETELEKAQKKRVGSILEKFRDKIKSLRKADRDTALADNLLRKAEKAKEEGAYKEAINYSMQSEGELEKIGLQQSISKKGISTAQKKLKEAEADGLFLDEVKKILNEAKDSYQSGFYVKAFNKALEAGDRLNRAQKAVEEVEIFLEHIDECIRDLKHEGIGVSELENSKEMVEKNFHNGDYIKAHSFIGKAEEYLDDKKDVLKNIISDIENKTEERGEEKERAHNLLDKARNVLEMGRSFKVVRLINEAKEVSGLAKEEKYDNIIEEAENLVEKAKKFGAPVKDVKNDIEDAKSFEKKGDMDQALEKAEETLQNLEDNLEPYSPKIDIKVSERFEHDQWNSTTISLENTGKGFAGELELKIRGGKMEGFDFKDRLKAGEKIESKGRIKPKGKNTKIIASVVRAFDKKKIEYGCELETTEEGSEERKVCDICGEDIDKDKGVVCDCGKTFHETCEEETKRCPGCGTKLKEEKKTKRKRVDMGI